MNKISADLFLDLIADPAKYRTYLERLEAEQQRLNDVVETVGKASELDTLRKEVEKQQAKLESDFTKKQIAWETEYATKLAAVEQLKTKVAQEQDSANKLLQEANQLAVNAAEKEKAFIQRERNLSKQEAIVESMKIELGASVTEYNEKLAKLRSVMV